MTRLCICINLVYILVNYCCVTIIFYLDLYTSVLVVVMHQYI